MSVAAPVRWRGEARQAKRLRLRQVAQELQRRRTPDDLHPKQCAAFESGATEILYGGAAGGGKSHLFRRAAIRWCEWVPGLQVYLFRREFGDLFKNHMEGPTAFPVMLAERVARGEVRIIWSKNQIRFKNGPKGTEEGGSVIHLCHCQHEKDVYGYQGAEIHVLMIDELTQWTRKMYTFLRSRVRIGGLGVPKWLRGRFPRILCGANPGGIGHNWVKADFVDVAPALAVTRMPKGEGGMLRQFIPALLEDNPSLTENDPDYEQRLEGLGDPALVRAMRLGDWDIVAGGMFDDVWDRNKHILAPFAIPASWRVDRGFDWGSTKPFSVGWWAESDGTPATLANGSTRHFPRGTLIRIAEWYGWDGRNPNVGLRLADSEIGKGIAEREKASPTLRGRVRPGPADSMIFNVEPGRTSIADEIAKHGIRFTEADKSPGSRKNGWQAMRRRLKAAKDGDRESPGLYAFATCTQFVRTIPTLARSERDPDDADTEAEDHIADETRYRVMAPRREARTFEHRV